MVLADGVNMNQTPTSPGPRQYRGELSLASMAREAAQSRCDNISQGSHLREKTMMAANHATARV